MQLRPHDTYKRKNCRIVDGQDTPEGACDLPGNRSLGIDLNRNDGGLWGDGGASAIAADDTYRGRAPFSEPETQNIRELVSLTADEPAMRVADRGRGPRRRRDRDRGHPRHHRDGGGRVRPARQPRRRDRACSSPRATGGSSTSPLPPGLVI